MKRAQAWRSGGAGTIFPRMLVMFLAVLMATALMIWGMMNPALRDREFQDTLRAQRYSISRIEQNLNGFFSRMDQLSLNIIYDANVQNSLTGNGTDRSAIVKLISSGAYTNSIQIVYVDNKGAMFNSSNVHMPRSSLDHLRDTNLFKAMSSTYARMACGLEANDLFSPIPASTQPSLLSLGRAVRHLSLNVPSGWLFFQAPPGVLFALLDEPLMHPDTRYILLDQRRRVVADSLSQLAVGAALPLRQLQECRERGEEYYFGESDLGDQLYLWADLEPGGLCLISCLPREAEQEIRSQLVSTLILSTILGCVAAFVLALCFSLYFSRPIMDIVHAMRRARDGDLDATVRPRHNDEIGELAYTFNHLTESIKKLIAQSERDHEELKTAEINALIYQINPHFIYNTLDNINILAQLSGDERISALISELSSLLRVTLSRGRDRVTLREELRHAGSYLRIMELRSGELFTSEIDCEKGIEDTPVIKIILQPLCENAVLHGFAHMEAGGHIRVSACRRGLSLLMRVEDNGEGLDAEGRRALTRSLTQNVQVVSGAHGIALNNIYRRLTLTYGPEGFEMRFYPSDLGGLCVEIEILNQFSRKSIEI